MKPIATSGWRAQPGLPEADAVAELAPGGQLRLVFLSDTLARVSWQSEQGYKEPRTWAIAPVAGEDVPWQGRERDSLAGFARPQLSVAANGRGLQTTKLAVQWTGGVGGEPVRLEWTHPSTAQVFQSDRVTSAYLSERRTGLVRHCVVRDPRDLTGVQQNNPAVAVASCS